MSSSSSTAPNAPPSSSSNAHAASPSGETKLYGSNVDLYDGWASTYDTDGNILPMVDDLVFNARVVPLLLSSSSSGPKRVLEIGCGTGRNTVKIKQNLPLGSTIYAIDVSEGMMAEAKKKIHEMGYGASSSSTPSSGFTISVITDVQWALLDVQSQRAELNALVGEGDPVDIVISTLVLEHVGLDAFFSAVGAHLKVGGWAWISSMHPFIGANTGAGYRRSEDGTKVHGVSYNYEIQEVMDAAKVHGLKVEGEVVEAGVGDDEKEAVAKFGARAKKAVGWKIFVGFLFRKTA
ncbi:hypothetical protein MD484_g4168, partial [Candolleomyces efflorescens]